MATAKTFDTSRVGGGTYELHRDATTGNYSLKSVGFDQVNKLTLPELASQDAAATTTTAKTDTAKTDTTTTTADPYKQLASANLGGDTQPDYGSMLKTPKVKEATVKDAGEMRKKEIEKAGGVETGQGQMYATDAGFQIAEDQRRDDVIASDANIGFQQSQTVDPITGAGRSQSDKFKQRFDPTKIQAAPQRTTGLQTVKSKASDALKKISNLSPIKIAGNALGVVLGAITPERTATQQVNIDHFDIRPGDTTGQRIGGNPATELYAGMNRNSAFGNLEKAGDKRIATRNSAKTQARVAKRGKEALDKFNAATAKMKEDASKYKAAKQKATQGPAGSGGGGNTDSGRVICTELHRTKEMATHDWIRDIKFTYKNLSKNHIKGYLFWAVPTVKHIQKYPRYRKIWKHLAQHRANDIAWRLNQGRFDLLGRIYAGIGEPLCWLIGKCVSDKQLKELKLNSWRRA